MKSKSIFLMLIAIELFTNCHRNEDVLKVTLEKLNGMAAVSYLDNYWSVDTDKIRDTLREQRNCTYNAKEIDTLIGGSYYIKYADGLKHIYNGNEFIIINQVNRTATVANFNTTPSWKEGYSLMPNQNSLFMIKDILEYATSMNRPITQKDSNNLKIIEIWFPKTVCWGSLRKDSTNSFSAKIFVNQQTKLPCELLLINYCEGYKLITHSSYTNIKPEKNISDSLFSVNAIPNDIDILYHKYISDIKVGESLPNWRIRNKKNELVRIADFKGKTLLIEIWNTRCKYCIESIPFLNDLYLKYKDSDFKIIYLNTLNQDTIGFSRLLRKYDMKFDIFYGSSEPRDYALGNFDPMEKYSFPTFILADKGGKVALINSGSDKDFKIRLIDLIDKSLK